MVLIGGTGLVGRILLHRLAAGHEVHSLQRRAGDAPPAAVQVHLAPASDWPALVASLAPDVAISALGTTMRQAGSQAAFKRVDHDLVLAFAAAAREAGASRFATVSSVGADRHSRAFYLRTKGEVEAALKCMGFDRLDIFRPGLLRGTRGGKRRLGERIGILVSPLVNLAMRGPLERYAAVDATRVAAAIDRSLAEAQSGAFIHHNLEIKGPR